MKKIATRFRPLILSRHPSHSCLRAGTKNLPLFTFKSVIRFGSITDVLDTTKKGGNRIEVNSVESIKNSSNKLLMKRCFIEAKVKTPEMYVSGDFNQWAENNYPIVAKSFYGSKGKGNSFISNKTELDKWMSSHTKSNYIYERYMNYGYEYRLHITEEGCFYACRKALKKDTKDEDKWHRHDSNCVWLLETNPQFNKPENWDDIVNHCIRALKSIKADLLCFDIRVQSPLDKSGNPREYQDFTIIECNSAPSMDNGTKELSVCAKKYIDQIPKILIKKANG